MPTAVLDLDITQLPAKITGLEAYDKAFVLIRYKKKPVGKTVVPVNNGCFYPATYLPYFQKVSSEVLQKAWLYDQLQWGETAAAGFIPPKASIAICTRERPEDLKRCLNAVIQLPDDGQEIIVIDNCPVTNATKLIVERYPSVRYICEERKGLDFARNRALNEAKHEIVAFTDDDAVPDPLWLRALVRNFAHPLVMCVNGMTMPLELETEAQEAFESYSPFGKGFLRKRFRLLTANPLITGHVGAGANMALRKSVINFVGYFDEALDAGTPTESGGDHEFFARILVAGYEIVYEPEALSWHRHRRTWKETKRAIRGYGIGVYAFWTRLLLAEKEIGVLKFPYVWFTQFQLRDLLKTILRRPGSKPLNLLLAELQGCLLGPWKYLKTRRLLKKSY